MFVPEHLIQAQLFDRPSLSFFGLKFCDQPAALLITEPGCVCWTIAEDGETGQSQQHRRYPFEDEHPLPAAEPKPSIGSQESCRDGRTEETRHRNRGCEQSDDPRTMLGWEPIRQIKNDAGEEACFGGTEKEPHQIKRLRVFHK